MAVSCFGLAFLSGAARLEGRLAVAARDAEWANAEWAEAERASTPSAYRIVDGSVASRRPTAWGDEVILVGVRGADGRGPVPRTLLVWMGAGDAAGAREGGLRRPDSVLAGEVTQLQGRRVERAERYLWPGIRARIGIRIRPIQSLRNPGTPDRERAWARRGIGARARLVDADWLLVLEGPGRGAARALLPEAFVARDRWRSIIAERFARSGLDTGLARALALGDRTGLSVPLRESFRNLGLSHLIAVSGLHVGLVGGLAGWLISRLLAISRLPFAGRVAPFGWSIAGATGTAWLYSWFSGASVSAQRAALLLALFAFARLAGRSLTPLRALLWSALVLLVISPAGLFDLGAALSFGACGALVLSGFWRGETFELEPNMRQIGLRARVADSIRDSFWVSVAVSLATAPLVLASGLPVALGSPAFNLVAIPWTGLVVIPAALAAAIGSGWLPEIALWALLFPAHLMSRAALVLADYQPQAVPVDGLPIWGVTGLAGLGVLAIRVQLRGFALVVWIVVAGIGAAPARHGRMIEEGPRVIFFDVGQGDAALVQGNFASVLIDTGSGPLDGTGGAALIRGLRSLGVNQLDALVITHGDLDHRAGAARVLEELRVRELWLPNGGQDDPRLTELAARAERRGVAVRWLDSSATEADRGDLAIDILWPLARASLEGSPGPRKRESRNEGSLVLRVGIGGARVLFTADVGSEVEVALVERAAVLDADVLKIGHHGSRHSTTSAFLEAVSPTHAVLSAPCDPARGLPNRRVLDRLVRAGVAIWWTGRDGAVSLRVTHRGVAGDGRGDGDGLDLRSWGESRLCFARTSGS